MEIFKFNVETKWPTEFQHKKVKKSQETVNNYKASIKEK